MKYKLRTPLDGAALVLGILNLSFAAFDIAADNIDWTTLMCVVVGVFGILVAGWQGDT